MQFLLLDSIYFSVLEEVMNALYNTSDHLPVLLKVRINNSQSQLIGNVKKEFNIFIRNPVSDVLYVNIKGEEY